MITSNTQKKRMQKPVTVIAASNRSSRKIEHKVYNNNDSNLFIDATKGDKWVNGNISSIEHCDNASFDASNSINPNIESKTVNNVELYISNYCNTSLNDDMKSRQKKRM